MDILKLRWSNFKSFHGEHELDFTSFSPGLYFIKGVNLSDPELGSNGAGKSTLFDALHWCLFGSSIRGTKTPQLVPWQNEGTPWAEVTYRTNGQKKRITRSYRPNNLLVTHRGRERGVKQEQLEDIIGFSSDTFQNSIVIGQFSQMFFDLKPRDKLSVFTELLNLDYWLECSQRVNFTLSVLREDQLEAEKTLARLEGVQSTLKNMLSSAVTKADESILLLRIEVTRLKKKLEMRKVKDKKLASKIGKLATEHGPIIDTWREVEGNIKVVQTLIGGLDEDLLSLKKAKDKCPACKQKISPKHRKLEQQRIAKKRATHIDVLNNLQIEYKEITKSLDKKSSRLDALKRKLDLSKSYKLQSRLDAVIRNIEKLGGQDKHIQECKSGLTANRQKMKGTRKNLAELNNDIYLAKYWVRGFKDIRLFEVDEALTSLQVEVNSYLADLGMADWSVNMEVERETKAGKLSRGFRVMVDPGIGSSSSPKPWEVWSGGEGQRLRLAGTLALSSLILRQFNNDCNIQIWDEKMVWLSGTGEDDMLDLLRETAKQHNKQIWLIDQHNLDFPFDGIITIVKDERGSHIEY